MKRISPEPTDDTDDEETTSASSAYCGDSYSGDSYCSRRSLQDSNPSLPGSANGSDSESDSESSSCESSACTSKTFGKLNWLQELSNSKTKVASAPTSDTILVGLSDRQWYRVANRLCGKAKYSRKTLCAAFSEADKHAIGYLSKNELATVFEHFDMPEGDSAQFYTTMGGDYRGLFWREAVAIMAPLLKPGA